MKISKKAFGFIGLGIFVILGIVDVNAATTKTEEVEETINYAVETIYDASMREGTTRIDQEGKNGSKKVTYSITYKYNKEVSKTKQSEKIIEPAQNKILVKGTKKY